MAGRPQLLFGDFLRAWIAVVWIRSCCNIRYLRTHERLWANAVLGGRSKALIRWSPVNFRLFLTSWEVCDFLSANALQIRIFNAAAASNLGRRTTGVYFVRQVDTRMICAYGCGTRRQVVS